MVKQIKGENMHKRNHKEAVYALKTTFNATSNNSRFIFVYNTCLYLKDKNARISVNI